MPHSATIIHHIASFSTFLYDSRRIISDDLVWLNFSQSNIEFMDSVQIHTKCQQPTSLTSVAVAMKLERGKTGELKYRRESVYQIGRLGKRLETKPKAHGWEKKKKRERLGTARVWWPPHIWRATCSLIRANHTTITIESIFSISIYGCNDEPHV